MNSDMQTTGRDSSGNMTKGKEDRNQLQRQQPQILPPVDIFEDEAGITLIADLPGATREQLGVRVDGDNLIIEATANAISVPRGMELIYSEAQFPSYRRQFTLSRELDPGRIEASLKDGVLRLTIPKSEEAKPRRIEVRAA